MRSTERHIKTKTVPHRMTNPAKRIKKDKKTMAIERKSEPMLAPAASALAISSPRTGTPGMTILKTRSKMKGGVRLMSLRVGFEGLVFGDVGDGWRFHRGKV